MVVEAAQKTQYQRYRALSYGVPAELLSAKSELPMNPGGVAVRWGIGQKLQSAGQGAAVIGEGASVTPQGRWLISATHTGVVMLMQSSELDRDQAMLVTGERQSRGQGSL